MYMAPSENWIHWCRNWLDTPVYHSLFHDEAFNIFFECIKFKLTIIVYSVRIKLYIIVNINESKLQTIAKSSNTMNLEYLPTPPLGQDMTQGQF